MTEKEMDEIFKLLRLAIKKNEWGGIIYVGSSLHLQWNTKRKS